MGKGRERERESRGEEVASEGKVVRSATKLGIDCRACHVNSNSILSSYTSVSAYMVLCRVQRWLDKRVKKNVPKICRRTKTTTFSTTAVSSALGPRNVSR